MWAVTIKKRLCCGTVTGIMVRVPGLLLSCILHQLEAVSLDYLKALSFPDHLTLLKSSSNCRDKETLVLRPRKRANISVSKIAC